YKSLNFKRSYQHPKLNITLKQHRNHGGITGYHRQGLHSHRSLESCYARSYCLEGTRRQDERVEQAYSDGVLGRSWRHKYIPFSPASSNLNADIGLHSPIRRIHPSKCRPLLHAQRHPSLPSAIAHFVRGELASSLRSRKPYNVNLLLGGVDPITGKPSLYWLDYLASLAPLPYAAHGYAQYYCLSILDKHHHPDIDYEQGMKILRMCTDELKRRLPIDFKGMLVKVVTKDGVKDVEFADDSKVACP
ncbi:putative proteasome subunit beta type-4, partial [Lachnellula willkommii]